MIPRIASSHGRTDSVAGPSGSGQQPSIPSQPEHLAMDVRQGMPETLNASGQLTRVLARRIESPVIETLRRLHTYSMAAPDFATVVLPLRFEAPVVFERLQADPRVRIARPAVVAKRFEPPSAEVLMIVEQAKPSSPLKLSATAGFGHMISMEDLGAHDMKGFRPELLPERNSFMESLRQIVTPRQSSIPGTPSKSRSSSHSASTSIVPGTPSRTAPTSPAGTPSRSASRTLQLPEDDQGYVV